MDLIRERGWVGENPDTDRGGGGEQGCVVLLVSNLPEELANVTNIFNMVGMYGDVVAVKILRNKPDCALVQCAKPHHARQVLYTMEWEGCRSLLDCWVLSARTKFFWACGL